MHTLANAELALMEVLWDFPEQTARALRERLYPDAERAQHGTVQRLLQRLEDKGFVSRDRTPAAHVFSATLSREGYAGSQLEVLAEKLTGGSVAPLLTHLIEAKRMSSAEIDRLRGILDQHDGGDSADTHGEGA